MARKLGLTRQDVIAAAAAIADEEGVESLSLSAVAERLGIRSPSLYHHVGAGLSGLRRDIALLGAAQLGTIIASAARDLHGEPALLAIARAYRAFARRHPGRLASMLPAPKRSEDEELYLALAAPVSDIVRVLGEMGIEGDDAIHVVRALRSYLHGFVDLERRNGFGMPQKIEASFERGITVFVSGLRAG